MPSFSPIAIVGEACLLPGAHSSSELWQAVIEKRSLLRDIPLDRWGVNAHKLLSRPADPPPLDRTWATRGGYIEGFADTFDPQGFALDSSLIQQLDPVFQWTLHTARQALQNAGHKPEGSTGVILGNLSFPTRSMSQWARDVWQHGHSNVHPLNRFMSGSVAQVLQQALHLNIASYALDAACASGLYAIKLACDALHDGKADVMLAGAVNAADDLFIHMGFAALAALSKSGQSRPFDAAADGLVPSEGAAFVVLKRLSDAEAANDRILAVIRGVGLSNDGRGRGFLAPLVDGQVRAMQQAHSQSGLSPDDISLIECHATGTKIGDATEITSTDTIYRKSGALPVSSLKSNLGHLITVAGIAGVIKTLRALEARVLPPLCYIDTPTDALKGTSLRLLTAAEPWETSAGEPRRAAVSAFGFGGNNAHLILEEHQGRPATASRAAKPAVSPPTAVAICGIGACVGPYQTTHAWTQALLNQRQATTENRTETFDVDIATVKFPPRDLQATLPQQLLMLNAAMQATANVKALPTFRTSCLIGMGTDTEVCRYGERWHALMQDGEASESVPPLLASGVVGTMPNIVANRINAQLGLESPSFTVSSEEQSGTVALDLAMRALHHHEIDAAVVGAVDIACNDAHHAAMRAVHPDHKRPGDAAIAFVLRRLDDALAAGDTIYATVQKSVDGQTATLEASPYDNERFGHAHAASSLLQLAAATLTLREGQRVHVPTRSSHPDNSAYLLHALRPPAHPEPVAQTNRHPRECGDPGMKSFTFDLDLPPAHPEPVEGSSGCLSEIARPGTFVVSLPAHPFDTRPSYEVMQPAPTLASFFDVWNEPPVLVTQDTVTRTTPKPPTHHLAARLKATSQQIADLHLAHIETQQRLHQQFLSVFQTSTQHLAHALSPSPVLQQVQPKPRFAPPWSQSDLLIHASGNISELFGPAFAFQDDLVRQVRMPEPPLMLASRVVRIDAVPQSMGTGTIITETDVAEDSWYLHQNSMPAGIMIESGQADLMLISYLGVDAYNRGERVYRLLGCELTYHGGLPTVSDTLHYEITVDGHAQQGDVRLFFFHYQCTIAGKPRLTVRQGQAGFFTDEELKDSAGILWDASHIDATTNATIDKPRVASTKRAFETQRVQAFAAGDIVSCFGDAYALAQTHVRTPRIQTDAMLLFDSVEHIDPAGGPWKRGYLRARRTISADDWFFKGHFKNDPCMPGTLMFEGCLQTMAFYLTYLGYTLEHDGARFEPVPDEPYALRCRGQVTPSSRELIYEIFVDEVHDGPVPKLYADLLCTVDGLKAFHAKRMGLCLKPDFPLTTLVQQSPELKRAVNVTSPTQPFDYKAMLASAWGKPSEAFGAAFTAFDGERRMARLPGPPYHFMSRVTHITTPPAQFKDGCEVEVEYDIPRDAWYFQNTDTMPFCVLLEAALQPCGWLATYIGSALTSEETLFFRNLDGHTAHMHDVKRHDGVLRTRVRLNRIAKATDIIIQDFSVECFAKDISVYKLQTVFGFFPKASLAHQAGLKASAHEQSTLTLKSDSTYDLTTDASRELYTRGHAGLPYDRLLMVDRITGWWPDGGEAKLGCVRGEKSVKPDDWFFRAHFFQDPVQPGSLGIEALFQLMHFYVLKRDMHRMGNNTASVSTTRQTNAMSWKYRGQVLPHNETIITQVDITSLSETPSERIITGNGTLWVDGKKIYEATNLQLILSLE